MRERRIVYCNPALAAWLDLEPKRIVGRRVEYHSETAGNADDRTRFDVPLTDLCPPPRALAGEPCVGTISLPGPRRSLVHRQAEFVPLDASQSGQRQRSRSDACRRGAGAACRE